MRSVGRTVSGCVNMFTHHGSIHVEEKNKTSLNRCKEKRSKIKNQMRRYLISNITLFGPFMYVRTDAQTPYRDIAR